MSSSNTIQFQLPKLTGKNYNNWSIQLKVFFRSQNLWDLLESGYTEVANAVVFEAMKNEEKELLVETLKRDQKALYVIFQAVDELKFERISAAETVHQARVILQKAYKGDERVKRVRLQTLQGDFKLLRMTDSESVAGYFDRVQSMVNLLQSNGKVLDEQRVVEKILRSLTARFDYVVIAIEEGQDTSTISVDRLLGSLGSHEQRMNQKDGTSLPERAGI